MNPQAEIDALRASRDEAYERVAAAEHRTLRLAAELEATQTRLREVETVATELLRIATAWARWGMPFGGPRSHGAIMRAKAALEVLG